MTQLEVPPAAVDRPPPPRREPEPVPVAARFAGDDAVPRGLAVTSAVTLRVIIVGGGIVLLGLFARRMMVVVLPMIVALLLATLLAPMDAWLRARKLRPAPAAIVPVLLAVVVFVGLWGLVIPPFVSQVPDVADSVQKGAGQVADAAKPLGLSGEDVQNAIAKARDQLKGGQVAGKLLTGARCCSRSGPRRSSS